MNPPTCPSCGAYLPSSPGSRCNYCGAEPAAKSAPTTSSTPATPLSAESVSSLPLEFAGLKRPKSTNMSSLNSVFTFSVPANGDRITIEDKDSVSESVYSKLETGGSVEVIYAKSEPETSAVRLNWDPPDFWGSLFVFTFEFIGLAFGSWMLSTGIKAGKNNLNLHSKGRETAAIVFDRWEESGSETSTYYVAYAYQVPGYGKQIFTNAEQSSQAHQKLKAGDRVSVRYLPENPKIVKLTEFHW